MRKDHLQEILINQSHKRHFQKSLVGRAFQWYQQQTKLLKVAIIAIVAVVVVFSGLYVTYKVQQNIAVNQLASAFKTEKLAKQKINPNANGKTDTKAVKLLTPPELANLHQRAIQLGYQKDLIGKLDIPAIHLKDFPVYQGMNQYTLALGAATYYPKNQIYEKGNFIIAGHNTTPEQFMFTNLGKLKLNNQIQFDDGVGIYHYKVSSVRHNVNPYQTTYDGKPIISSIFYNNRSKRYLTLFTCEDASGATRTVVTADFERIDFLKRR